MKKKILIVDDEPQYLAVLKGYIAMVGDFECISCNDGRSALDILEKEHFDCILLDLVMPEVGGIQVLKEVHDRKYGAKVVIISGFLTDEIAKQCRKFGAYDLIDKPIDRHKLKCILKRVSVS